MGGEGESWGQGLGTRVRVGGRGLGTKGGLGVGWFRRVARKCREGGGNKEGGVRVENP